MEGRIVFESKMNNCQALVKILHILLVFSGWDMSSILILLHLLPPSPQGHKIPGKLSARQASDHLVKFIKARLQFDEIRRKITVLSPFLILLTFFLNIMVKSW